MLILEIFLDLTASHYQITVVYITLVFHEPFSEVKISNLEKFTSFGYKDILKVC